MNNFRKKLIVELSITFVVVGALIGGIAFFGINLSNYADEIVRLRSDLAGKSASLRSLSFLKADYGKAKDDLNVLYSVVPQKDRLINLSKEFQFLVPQSNANQGSRMDYGFTFVEETAATDQNLGFIRFRLNLSGEFDRLIKFVQTLQNFRYLTAVDSLSINRENLQGRMVVNGRVFFR
jgi:hypothetical protein